MTPEHLEVREALGGYVLGALDPSERRRVERHLSECDHCAAELTRLSPLPGLLSRVTAQEARGELLVPRDDLLDGVIVRLTDTERTLRMQLQRWRAAAIAGCLAALVAVVLTVEPWRSEPDRRFAAVDPVAADAADTTGQAAAIAWEWGTTVELQLADLPRRDGYVLWAIADDGRRERAGTWGATASGAAQVRGASSIDRSELHRVEVTDREGRVIMGFDFSGDSAGWQPDVADGGL